MSRKRILSKPNTLPNLFWGGGGVVPTWSFDPTAVTFAAKMAKRAAPGPFAAAPIVQGKFDGSGTADVLKYVRGSQISDDFYANFDPYQGGVEFWWTPEKSRVPAQTVDEYLFRVGAAHNLSYRHDDNALRFNWGGQTVSVTLSTIAGTLYNICVRWDCDNKLDGTNYLCVSINNTHTFGGTSPLTPPTPDSAIYLGCYTVGLLPLNGILEGFTVYRRPLYDGTYGVDAGNGDEINLIWAAGAGKKPAEVTGADDICFQLPTDGSTGELATGTGEAWSWPWSDNELDNYHFQDEIGGLSVKWDIVNGATLANAASADILFDARSQKISVDAANEGIKQAFAVSAGEDYWVGAWVKTGGANQGVDLRIYDVTNTADVVELTTDATAWTLLKTCFEVPAGCNSIAVYIESTDADTYDIHVGQVQVLPNLVDNGGMEGTYTDESGGGAGTINVAPGWNDTGVETDGSDTLDESATAHSGSKSQQINVDSQDEGIAQASVFASGKWYCFTAWLYGTSGNAYFATSGGGQEFNEIVTPGVGSWTKYSYVFKATDDRSLYICSSGGAANFLIDDVSIVELDDVSITATAASEANSAEDSGIRVDGLDSCTQPISELGATSGKVRFDWTPRRGAGDWEKFGISDEMVVSIRNDNNNMIRVYLNTATRMRLYTHTAGTETLSNWDSASIVAGTTYLVEVEYNSTQVKVSFDGTVRMTTTPAGGVDFGANIPDTVYTGTDSLSTHQSDAVFSAP